MGLLDELKRIARPGEDEDEDETFDDFDTMGTGRLDRTAVREKPAVRQSADLFDSDRSDSRDRRSTKVVNIHTTTQLQVVLVEPENRPARMCPGGFWTFWRGPPTPRRAR